MTNELREMYREDLTLVNNSVKDIYIAPAMQEGRERGNGKRLEEEVSSLSLHHKKTTE